MAAEDAFSGWGQIARVRHVADDGYAMYVDLPAGQTGRISGQEPVDFEPGDIILIRPDGTLEIAPEDVWREESWVAVVRIKNADSTVVDSGGHARMVPTRTDVEYQPGNTVEVLTSGVVRVLSDKPIRLLDLPEVDDGVVEQFAVNSADIKETFDDFGGLSEVVARAKKLIETPLKYRNALDTIGAGRVKGVLFTGPPGTGKTMLARVIARESEAAFYQISGPEVVSKWYGQSEEVLRKLFEHAKNQEDGAIIFFDEIDSVAAQRNEDAHEASRRIVAQLLTLMDGFKKSNVVVIAATNRPQDIDFALRRPGRFDWEINFPLPDRNDRLAILRARARRLATIDSLPHAEIADRTDSWSPAHLAAIWIEAALLAAIDDRKAIMAEDYVGGFECVAAQRRQAADLS